MTLARMYELAKTNLDYLCERWDNDLAEKYGMATAAERLKECRQERDDLIKFKKNGFKE